MLISEITLRVRYSETDRMGYVYYGNYAQYYEVARVEALRKIGFSYKEIEDRGILLPVIDFSIQYKKPAFYDDELTIITRIKELPGVKFTFHYECYNVKKELLNTGKVTLVFIDREKNKPCIPPDWFMDVVEKHFNHE
jgi:acyl-CoA thioester hydrolase